MHRLLALLFCLYLPWASFAAKSAPVFDVVFDIDWTLFYPVQNPMDDKTVSLPEGYFRMADGVVDTLIAIHRKGHRISLFSGGTKSRNHALASYLLEQIAARGEASFQFYKVLNFDDLTLRPGAKDDASFTDKWMKDLRKINANLQYVVLIDDSSKFSVPGQERNLYWIEKTYNFQPQFGRLKEHDGYDAPTYKEWLQERRKIISFSEHFLRASLLSATEDPLKALWEYRSHFRMCRELF
ncbi:hypothetical protein [Bdellovibrio sp. HCB2-146]|uniref:hypothetical protein n=1 Tax=Bdellovibrio sp. HCB2-146 TaxID=3394362 RepID=UPI0039BCE3AC